MQKVEFNLKPSRQLALIYLAIASGSLFACTQLPYAIAILSALFVLILLYTLYTLKKYAALRLASSIVKLQPDSGQHWMLVSRCGEQYLATLQADSFVAPLLLVLHFQVSGASAKKFVPVAPDMLTPEYFRKLRATIRIQNEQRQHTPPAWRVKLKNTIDRARQTLREKIL